MCPPLKKVSAVATARTTSYNATTAVLVFIFSFFIVAFYAFSVNSSVTVTLKGVSSWAESLFTFREPPIYPQSQTQILYSLNCTQNKTEIQTCPTYPSPQYQAPSSKSCPDYFRWIAEDLRPWMKTGITRKMVEGVRDHEFAHFRLVILNGKAYVQIYEKAFQTRDTFTLWGILQLILMYPGKLPDLDLMFNCHDRPGIMKRDFEQVGTVPPPLFRYCGSDETFDIAFPDWSFWGWPEVNVKPWNTLLKELKNGNKKVKWSKREPYAYWKGNPNVGDGNGRRDLMRCNVSRKQDWNARLYMQDWRSESEKGYKQSNLADQCTHRYKIYIEGNAWSVSNKYILTCDSPTLIVSQRYYDMFTRGLVPLQHYWPINNNDKCHSIKFAVDWGNTHKKQAQKIGKAGSNFVSKNLTMEYVYDYMFHLLNEYAKLLIYKPTIPENAVEFCSETMACHENGMVEKFMMETMVKAPRDTMPCNLPPPLDADSRLSLKRRNETPLKQVEMWQKKYWDDKTKHH